jgi:hypothetical protein
MVTGAVAISLRYVAAKCLSEKGAVHREQNDGAAAAA